LVIGIWGFDIVWNLSIVIWDFSAVFRKARHFYMNQLKGDFDVSLSCNALILKNRADSATFSIRRCGGFGSAAHNKASPYGEQAS